MLITNEFSTITQRKVPVKVELDLEPSYIFLWVTHLMELAFRLNSRSKQMSPAPLSAERDSVRSMRLCFHWISSLSPQSERRIQRRCWFFGSC